MRTSQQIHFLNSRNEVRRQFKKWIQMLEKRVLREAMSYEKAEIRDIQKRCSQAPTSHVLFLEESSNPNHIFNGVAFLVKT
jgi:hypothetical protein